MDIPFQAVKYLVVNIISKNRAASTIQYWLAHSPLVTGFSWNQGETFASSPYFLAAAVAFYISLTFLLSTVFRPTVSPRALKLLTAVHNMILLSLSFVMAIGVCVAVLFHLPDVGHLVCFPKNTPPTGPIFFWCYIFYLSKFFEFLDTLLIILSNSSRRLTFLHVYHHATVVIMCYISLHTSQSLFPGVMFINSTVHVIMYSYYFLCTIGKRPKWKKFVTDVQIVQFFASFAIMAWIFYYHFSGSGCSGIWGWGFDAIFITSLLMLFLDFHAKNYSSTKHKTSNNKVKQVVEENGYKVA